MTDAEPPLPELRASDAEREQAAETLRAASTEGRLSVDELEERIRSAYSARTRRELEQLVADVVVSPAARPFPAVSGGPRGVTVREGPGGTAWVISILGGHDRRGRWRVAPQCTVLNIMGSSDLDLCDAELADRHTIVTVVSLMGGGDIRVPDGVEVEVSNFAIMGGNDVRLGDEAVAPGGPLIRIRLVSIMGGCSVRRGRKRSRAERRRERELGRAQDAGQLDP